ncbi:MAG: hypothetical protein KAH99_01695, partial [Verrucomicrobia bacterium]|nr:hypothetical protein [Verrucomicrobiota bacterium]
RPIRIPIAAAVEVIVADSAVTCVAGQCFESSIDPDRWLILVEKSSQDLILSLHAQRTTYAND